MPVEGPWVDRTVGLEGVRVDIAMMRTPDGHSRLELTKFHHPAAFSAEPSDAPANVLGIRRIMFAVDDIDDVIARLRAHGGELIGEVAQYEKLYRLCYLRGPAGMIVALAEQLTPSRSTLSRRCSSSCAASSTALCRHSAARYSQAISPVRWMRRKSPYTNA